MAWGERGIGIGAITGRDFSGINLPVTLQDRTITLASDRAWAWVEGSTNRVALEGDVRIAIGSQAYRAARAVVWLEPIEAIGMEGTPVEADQLAIVFEGVTAAGAAPGSQDTQTADHLMVTGIVTGPAPTLTTDLLRRARPGRSEAFVERAEARLAAYLTSLLRGPDAASTDDSAILTAEAARAGDHRGPVPPATRTPVIPPEGGTIAFSAKRIEMTTIEGGEKAIELSEGVSVQFVPPDRARTVLLQAERGVVFLSSEARTMSGVLGSNDVSGIYIEGNASVTDGQYTLRGSKMFYDPATERATVFDAVFYTWDQKRGMPLYLRAATIRQSARGEWTAEKATLANVALAEPHFSIGAESLTVRLAQPEPGLALAGAGGGAGVPTIEAEGVGFRAGSVPLLGLPRYEGELRPSPLRDVRVATQDGDVMIGTRWDLFTIFNRDAPEGSKLDLLLDGYFDRGPAAGLDAEWEREDMTGDSLSYYIYDNGTDLLSSGARISHDDESRGMFTVGNIWRVSDLWTLYIEGSYISDPTFVNAFFDPLGETRREFTNSFLARRQTDQDMFSLEARGTFNDFISNEYLLQSQGYVVENLPEAKYARFSDQIFDLLSYSTENSVGWYQARFSQPELRDYGYNNKRRARAGFGLLPGDTLAEQLEAENFPEGGVGRFDTRHELEMPLVWGPFNVVPFVVGRMTAWSEDFDGFDGTDGVEDAARVWGSTGARASTTIVNVNNGVDSRTFDLHRMRHIIEPYMSGWIAGTNVDPGNLPVYDREVEPLADGTIMNMGIRQTWQTERGPERNMRSVDWITLDLGYTWSSSNAPKTSPFGRYISYQPELSNPGEFANASTTVLLTEALTIVGDCVWDFDEHALSRGSIGGEIDHGDGFTTYSELRYLRDFDDTIVASGVRMELTSKYSIGVEGTWNLIENHFQNTNIVVTRRFAQWTIEVSAGFDDISDIFEAGVSVRPAGFGGDSRRRPFTFDEDYDPVMYPVSPEEGRVGTGPFRDE